MEQVVIAGVGIHPSWINPIYFALQAQELLNTTDATVEDLTDVSVKNHRHSVDNPNVMYRKEFSQYTNVNHPPPGGLVPVPYAVAVADFPGGMSILGLVSNAQTADELELGDEVQTVAAPVGDKIGYAFLVTRLAGS